MDTADQALLERVRRELTRQGGGDGVDPDELGRALGLRNPALVERLFRVFDADADGVLDGEEIVRLVDDLLTGDADARVRFAFRVHDEDGNGVIDRPELRRLLDASVSPKGVSLGDELIERLVDALIEAGDLDGDDLISMDEFVHLMRRHPRAYAQITGSFDGWLRSLDTAPAAPRLPRAPKVRDLSRQVHSRGVALAWLGLFIAAHVALFSNAFLTYQADGASLAVCIARGCGACLNLDGALVLFPVMRTLATAVREWPVARVLPLDHLLEAHKIVGHTIAALTLVHTIAHFSNYSATVGIEAGALHTAAGLTGLGGLAVLGVMWVFALPRFRRGKRFTWFYVTHFGFVAWFALMLAHGPVFWKWTVVPLGLYGVEMLLRQRRLVHSSSVTALEALPSRVTRIAVRRPAGFEFEPGAYAYLRLPRIARHEWHPFTISSHPERRDELEFHVRAVGDWTGALRTLAQEGADDLVADVDGPYGSPSTEVFESRHAVLVAAGIGATPFASVLSSIAARAGAEQGGPESVRFFWVARTPSCFEWFARLLAEEVKADDERIDVNIHMTAGAAGLDGVALNLAIELCYAQSQRDVVTGLESKTRLGRPDWKTELEEVVREHGTDVDVYFCGPPALSRDLARECHRRGLRFRAEAF